MAAGTPPRPGTRTQSDGSGLAQGLGAYLWWGFLPLYFPLLAPAGSVEIIAHRVLWSLVFCLVGLAVTGTLRRALDVLRSRATLARLAAGGVLVAGNWLVFVYAVLSDHTVDAALGYYINPILTVVLAVLVLRERLQPAQWAAVGLGTTAVLVLTVGLGRPPWISLALAGSFGLYGLIKNRVGRSVPPLTGLAVETAVLAPLALVWLLAVLHGGSFATGPWHALALAGAGVVTAVPLLLFAGAARRLPLSVVGLLQYLTPTMQFVIGVVVFGERMPAARWWGFALVWAALVILTAHGLRAGRLARRQPATVNQ
ncbi:EamA family transporter RarD [Isoptericola sp. b441]|uniref:EamA family transporter RarD n=1 Tax=Actinotalea lenta TaxID=3064654 RepID=A0ABT9D5L9_9CELL|nr:MULTISPECIES: EamA family transporter RarD [unclassified Isoptericola]MDO8105775.1 EamA family transporter RarD [Isoptericola sp. b441]MDO8122480.1 EamA family transporter RarD [Isoptericola sp. b490]